MNNNVIIQRFNETLATYLDKPFTKEELKRFNSYVKYTDKVVCSITKSFCKAEHNYTVTTLNNLIQEYNELRFKIIMKGPKLYSVKEMKKK
jgi:hypothetical protein